VAEEPLDQVSLYLHSIQLVEAVDEQCHSAVVEVPLKASRQHGELVLCRLDRAVLKPDLYENTQEVRLRRLIETLNKVGSEKLWLNQQRLGKTVFPACPHLNNLEKGPVEKNRFPCPRLGDNPKT